jgi:hypothetical protein
MAYLGRTYTNVSSSATTSSRVTTPHPGVLSDKRN